jgi:hypothetical protein
MPSSSIFVCAAWYILEKPEDQIKTLARWFVGRESAERAFVGLPVLSLADCVAVVHYTPPATFLHPLVDAHALLASVHFGSSS